MKTEQERSTSPGIGDANDCSTIANENGSIVVVATYRTNEVGEDHALSKMVTDLREMLPSEDSDDTKDETKTLFLMKELAVAPLSLDQINTMLAELLSRQSNKTMELARAVHQKSEFILLYKLCNFFWQVRLYSEAHIFSFVDQLPCRL